MASPAYDKEAYWPDVLVFTCSELKSRFNKFDVLRFTEHNVSGFTPQGIPCHWHIYSVVAKLSQRGVGSITLKPGKALEVDW